MIARLAEGYVDGAGNRHRILIPEIAVAEAERAGCDLALLCAVLEMETGSPKGAGRNIFGHDRDACMTVVGRDIEVTERTYEEYKSCVARGGKRNGVGPMQLTYHAYQTRADELGGAWRPEINVRVGCEILAGYLRSNSIYDTLSRYNTGKPGQSRYADAAMPLVDRWRTAIRG